MVLTIALKTYFAYYVDLSLGVKGLTQNLILLMNPYSLVALILSVFLFFKGRKAFWFMFVGGFLLTFYYMPMSCISAFSQISLHLVH